MVPSHGAPVLFESQLEIAKMTNNRMFEQGATSRGVALATSANLAGEPSEAMIGNTGWSWADAVDEGAEIQRDERIFGKRGHKATGQRRRRSRRPFDHARFERETGMTYGDALEMAIDHRRDKRLYGSRH